ncbi:ABC transporter ATP-binding protein [Brevibacillus invocatus]|uniref:ABC transporter ATP-binding protein n=1 Tax=Brevibacillus invocatus TaxID=173959 RepID=UPI00203FE71A|nr:ABC transporter ATP-binding protein [Brevibacillus invocatus]MCM3082041.1 ABC transporter ATP-binding protein/permease [Brevibacillus invocatus]MCM3432452.1 ABC transporter ATP-binding protein/permease [Brevibacillus invocatus]
MLKLFSYLRPHWVATLLAPLLMLLEVAMDLMQPILMANIIDEGVMKGDLAHIQQTGLLMLGVALVGLVGGVGCSIYSSIASQRFGEDLRHDVFRRVQTFSFRNLDELNTGSLITRLTNDIVQLQTMVQMLLRIFVRSPFLAIGSMIMAVMISPKLAIILAIAVPLLFVVMFLIIRNVLPLFSNVQKKMDKLNTVLQENLAGIRVSKAFVRADYENERFSRANADYTQGAIKAQRLVAINMPILTMILNVCIVAVLWLGGKDAIDGSFEVGSLVAFINYVTQVLFSVSSVAMLLVRVSSAKVSADRIQEVLHTESEIQSPANPVRAVHHQGEVVFENVTFAYGSDAKGAVLRDVSFSVKPGQNVAIIGATGSGKSSLVGLIPRLYDTTSGRILIDGSDVREYELQSLREKIGIVLQETILFTGSIRDNIRYGKPDASDEEVMAAAQAAQAHDFIMAMPDGYDTQLGQRGINLSGGQKQRISIARALILQPSILILDDSTSAIDMGTESRIQGALARLMHGRTSILIAQRISSVMDADKILVLEDGRVVGEGTHHELLASCELYQDIYRSQLGWEEPSYG